MNQQVLGQRLRAARENRGLSQQATAEALGLTRTAITQIEKGNRSVSTVELAEFSKIFHYPIADFFSEDAITGDDYLITLYRIAPNLQSDPEVRDQVTWCFDVCREGAELEALLRKEPLTPPPTYSFSAPRSTGEAIVQGNSIAEQERQRLGIGKAPIADMSDLIASQGIWVSGAKLPDEMSGLFINARAIGMAILVNFDHIRERKRFSYAHEYAHALLDRERSATVSTYENSAELIERRANAFAAAFLMPQAGIVELLRLLDKGQDSRQGKHIYDEATGNVIEAEIRPTPGSQTITNQDVAIISHRFGVSYQAATYRLRSLGIVSHAEQNVLLEQEHYGKSFLNLLKCCEIGDSAPRQDREVVTQVLRLALEAYRMGEISRGYLLQLGQKLNLEGETVTELANPAKAA